MSNLQDFQLETRDWLAENCPASMRTPMPEDESVNGGAKKRSTNPDSYVWLDRMAGKGWTVPIWPKEYGGAGLNRDEFVALIEEMAAINARTPLTGMGISMIGPTLLEYGDEDQKERHLPKIACGAIRWCQGYSEPGAGSDLASLQTRAVADGDNYIVNGQKIWTSGADLADWIFCLVRTDPDVPKHEGISFLLFSMDSEGVETRPIKLISGSSPFCETFFTDVVVPKRDLVHRVNQGWTVAKRLLQHERSGGGLRGLANAARKKGVDDTDSLPAIAKASLGLTDGKISDPVLRNTIVDHEMNARAFRLTQGRALQETEMSGKTPEFATSMFKLIRSELGKESNEIELKIRGTQALGWEGDQFDDKEKALTRAWLRSKASTIAAGSSEVQLNIISKRILTLPD